MKQYRAVYWAPYSFFRHDCKTIHDSTIIIKFADDTTMIGLIFNNKKSPYREEVEKLERWSRNNNLALNWKNQRHWYWTSEDWGTTFTSISINGDRVETVQRIRFLVVHIIQNLSWSSDGQKTTLEASLPEEPKTRHNSHNSCWLIFRGVP